MAENKCVMLYFDKREYVRKLNLEQKGQLLDALYDYGMQRIIPDFSEDLALEIVFMIFKESYDMQVEAYDKAVKKYAESGKKGAAKRWKKTDEEENEDSNTVAEDSKNSDAIFAINPDMANDSKNSDAIFAINPDMANDSKNSNNNNNNNNNNNILEASNDALSPCGDEPVEKSTEPVKVTASMVADLYNSICVSYPKVTVLSEKRKKAINARLKSMNYSLEAFRTLFEKAEMSDFLKGRNNRDWRANFDWLIRDANMAKVLDGNYDNRSGGQYGRGAPGWLEGMAEWAAGSPGMSEPEGLLSG